MYIVIACTCCTFFLSYSQAPVLKKDPLLVVALMIKNEAPVIDYTLTPMVQGGIDSFLIFDTGSTDDTIEKVRQFFSAHNITNYAIEQENFVDFATSRNRALDLVDKHFPEATFIMMPDAEWLLRNGAELLKFCERNKEDCHASYLIRMVRNGQLEYYVDRLMRRESYCRFKSPVHEYLESPSVMSVPAGIFFEWNSTQYGDDKSRKRWARDLGFLLKAYAENPTDARTSFYLGQTYACLGDFENALRFYELRSKLPSWEEENYETLVRIAGTIEILAAKDTDKKKCYDWSLAMWYYLKAFSTRQGRIEPLIHIARHYLACHDYAIAYLFAIQACEIPYPEHEILFIEKEMYVYERYDIVAQCGLKIGEFAKGEWAVKKALEHKPDDQHLQELFKMYVDQKLQE